MKPDQYILASTSEQGSYDDPTDREHAHMAKLESMQKLVPNMINAYDFVNATDEFYGNEYTQTRTYLHDDEKFADIYGPMTETKANNILAYTTFDQTQRTEITAILRELIDSNQSLGGVYYGRASRGDEYASNVFNLVKQILTATYWWRGWVSGIINAVRAVATVNCEVRNFAPTSFLVNTCAQRINLIQIKGGLITDVERDWLSDGSLKQKIQDYLSLEYINYDVDIDILLFDNFRQFEEFFNENIL